MSASRKPAVWLALLAVAVKPALAQNFPEIEKGRIRRIEAVGTGVPYHMSPGWPP